MNCKIIKKQTFDILEKVETHTTKNGANIKSVPAFWTRVKEDGTEAKLLALASDTKYVFGVCYCNEKEDGSFDYSIAVECGKDTPAPQGLRKNTIPERDWAVFPCYGAMPEAIQSLWKKIHTKFFPQSEYQPTNEAEIEAYPEGDTDSPEYYCEIWLPVVKKA